MAGGSTFPVAVAQLISPFDDAAKEDKIQGSFPRTDFVQCTTTHLRRFRPSPYSFPPLHHHLEQGSSGRNLTSCSGPRGRGFAVDLVPLPASRRTACNRLCCTSTSCSFASWMLAGQCKPPSHPPSKPPRIDAALARNPARLASCRPDCRCLGQRPRWLFTTGKLPPRLRLLLQRGTATQTRREPSRGGKARMVASRRRLAPFPHPNPRPDSNQR